MQVWESHHPTEVHQRDHTPVVYQFYCNLKYFSSLNNVWLFFVRRRTQTKMLPVISAHVSLLGQPSRT